MIRITVKCNHNLCYCFLIIYNKFLSPNSLTIEDNSMRTIHIMLKCQKKNCLIQILGQKICQMNLQYSGVAKKFSGVSKTRKFHCDVMDILKGYRYQLKEFSVLTELSYSEL